MKVATKSTDEAIEFFGELCPLSNFHHIPILYNEVNYHSSEQMIQHMKAKLFGDKIVQKHILDAKPHQNANKSPKTFPTSISKPELTGQRKCAEKDWKPNSCTTQEACRPS